MDISANAPRILSALLLSETRLTKKGLAFWTLGHFGTLLLRNEQINNFDVYQTPTFSNQLAHRLNFTHGCLFVIIITSSLYSFLPELEISSSYNEVEVFFFFFFLLQVHLVNCLNELDIQWSDAFQRQYDITILWINQEPALLGI